MTIEPDHLRLPPAELARLMNDVESSAGGFAAGTGITLQTVAADEVVATLLVDPRHHQPMGIVHGGVWATMVETLASVGAAVSARKSGASVVGVENSTSFIRSMSAGLVRGVAKSIHRDESTQAWVVELTDESGRIVAHGTVRLAVLRERTTS